MSGEAVKVVRKYVLKKQKRTEEWALAKKQELEAAKKATKSRKLTFNRAKQYAEEYDQQDFTTKKMARPALPRFNNPFMDFDPNLFTPTIPGADPHALRPSEEAIQCAKDMVKKHLVMNLQDLNVNQVRSLSSSLWILASASQIKEKKDMFSSLAVEINNLHDQMTWETDDLLTFEHKIQSYREGMSGLQVDFARTEARAELDQKKKEEYDQQQELILQLEAQLVEHKAKLQKLDDERAQLAVEQEQDHASMIDKKMRLQTQQPQVKEWMLQRENALLKRNQLAQAWGDRTKDVDIDSPF